MLLIKTSLKKNIFVNSSIYFHKENNYLRNLCIFASTAGNGLRLKNPVTNNIGLTFSNFSFEEKKGYIWPRVEGSVRKKRVSVLQASLAIQQCCCHNVMFSCLNMATAVFPYTFFRCPVGKSRRRPSFF